MSAGKPDFGRDFTELLGHGAAVGAERHALHSACDSERMDGGIGGRSDAAADASQDMARSYNLDPSKRSEQDKLLERCKERSLYLLTATGKTERQLRRKLLESGTYTEAIVEQTIDFLKRYHYLDDLAYARRFAAECQGKRSKKEIEKKLYERGVGREEIRLCLEELDADAEYEAARRFLLKKCRYPAETAPEEKRRLYAALVRKGFSGETARRALFVEEE